MGCDSEHVAVGACTMHSPEVIDLPLNERIGLVVHLWMIDTRARGSKW
jgi:hypothetical protein